MKTRMKQKGATNQFDDILIASSSDIVSRPDSEETVETSLQTIENVSLPGKVDGVFHVYHALDEIGLTIGSETMDTIIAGMSTNSILVLTIGSGYVSAQYPTGNGTLLVVKAGTTGMAFFQDYSTNSLYTNTFYTSWSGWRNYEVTPPQYDDTPTDGSSNLVNSGAVYDALVALQSTMQSYSDAADQNVMKTLNATIAGLESQLTTHTGDNTVHITSLERQTWNAKQNALTFDSTPTAGSNNPVTSSGIKTALDGKSDTTHNHDGVYVPTTSVGAASGVVPLGADSKIAAQYLPSYVDDVIDGTLVNTTTFNDTDGTAVTPEAGKIYVDTTTNKSYRWSGSVYAEIGGGVALGETSATAYRGDRGKVAYDHSQTATTRSNTTASRSLANGGQFVAVTAVTDNGGHVVGTQSTTFTLPTIQAGNRTVSQKAQPSGQVEGDLWFETL